MDLSEYASVLSKLEKTLIIGGHRLVASFFASWPSDLVFILSRSSFRMNILIRGYVASRWDYKQLLSRWVANVDGLLGSLDSTGSFICGPIVTDFFAGGSSSSKSLDMCVSRRGFAALTHFMESEGYGRGTHDVSASSFRPGVQEKVFSFVFHRQRGPEASITAHLVRCDTLDFFVRCATSEYSCLFAPSEIYGILILVCLGLV